MDLVTRLAVVLILIAVGAVITNWYRRRSARDQSLGAVDHATGAARWPDLSSELAASATASSSVPSGATWVIFSTPLCVSCSAVQADLERNFPHHRVVKIDATERPDLAHPYEVKRAPTTILADASGRIVERFVGPESVREFIGTVEDPARMI